MKDTYLVDNYSINLKGNIIDLTSPIVMSIVNTTPDSFYDGGKNSSTKKVLNKVEEDIKLGATIIDIGGYSSKPGANYVTLEEELHRTIYNIEQIMKRFPKAFISIDTFRGTVAKQAIEAGAAMINDISAFNMDAEMINTIEKYSVPYVLMHMKGIPENMQLNPKYKKIVEEIISFLDGKLNTLKSIGQNDVIIDPGFGFGKTIKHNYTLMNKLSSFKSLNRPILVGISRKSMINKILNIKSLESINGTTALNMYALSNGANILRVHDVKQAIECVKIHREIIKNN